MAITTDEPTRKSTDADFTETRPGFIDFLFCDCTRCRRARRALSAILLAIGFFALYLGKCS